MKRLSILLAAASCVMLMSTIASGQAVFRSNVTSGNWNNSGSWALVSGSDVDGVPDFNDDVFIQAGHTITLTGNEACKDLHISTGTTDATTGGDGRVVLGSNTLQVNGKLRCYFAAVGTTPGTSSTTVPSAPITIAASSSGKLSFVGSTRNITNTGEWGAGNTGATTTFAVEISMTAGQTATIQTSIKASSWNVVSGILDAGSNTISADNGTSGQGDITIASGATVISAQSGTSNNVFQRSGSTLAGALTVNGLLQLSGSSPNIQMTTINFNGTIDYSRSGAQTLAVANNGGADPTIYTNVKLSGSGVKTTVAVKTTSIVANGSLEVSGGATPPTFAIGSGGTFSVSSTGTTISYTATGAQTTGVEWDPNFQNATINNSAGVTLGGSKTINGTLTLTNGTLAVGTNTLTLNGTVSATSGVLSSSATGTVNYNQGSNGQAVLAANYGNLTFSNFNKALASSGVIGIAGTFAAGTATGHTVTGSTIEYNGSSSQSTPAGFSTYNDLTINNSAGVALGVNTTVDGVLALTSGDLSTGSFTLFMGNGATSSGNGDVVGNVNRSDLNSMAARSFGNPNVQITETAGTVTDLTVNLAKGSAPNDFTNAIKRLYTITPNGGNSLVVTVRLHYLTSELNAITETDLQLWEKVGSSWVVQGRTSQSTASPNNWAELTSVNTLSPWTLAGPSAPTDAAMLDFKATRYDGRVLLEWQTGYEVNNVGFSIYREQNGSLTKVTPEPIAGSALIAGPEVTLRAGFAYSWWDNEIADCGSQIKDCYDNARYWLEDLDLTGRTTIHGPFAVEQATDDNREPPPGKGKVALLSTLGRDAAGQSPSAPVETKARVAKLTESQLSLQAGVASLPAAKLSVQREGWYRVEQPELVGAGFSSNVDPRKLQLMVDGQQVPIIVNTAKNVAFGPADSVEFYGVGIDSPFTANHVYWLVAGSDNGLRIKQVGGKGGSPIPTAFPYTVERRDKVVYFPALKNGGGEKFFGPLILNAQPVDQSVTLQHIATSAQTAALEVSLQGFTNTAHSVNVVFNGAQMGTIQFSGLAKGMAQYSIPQSSLKEGSNQVQLIGPSGFSDMSVVEYVRVTYLHANTSDGNALKFPAMGKQQATIGGFTTSNVRVVDITIPSSPQEVDATVKREAITGLYSVTATAPGTGARTLLAFASDQQKKPAALTLNQPSNWRNPSQAADYVAFTRKDLLSLLGPLKTQRQSQGLSVATVDVEDVYDEFSYGNKTPQALKDFLGYAKSSWAKAPRFVLLAGDATYDPKNYTGTGDFDIVPTKLVETAFSETATDDWLVDFNGDGIPDMAVGRLPVRTVQEMSALVSKIVGYDQQAATSSVLLVADRNQGFDFEAADDQLHSLIPAGLTVTDIRRGQVGDSTARSQLLDAINHGQKLVNFYGHGSTRVWTSAPILTAADATDLVNTGGLALFDAMTCLNGFFHDVSIESLGEALLKAQGGAIAVWASSGLTEPSAQVQMNEEAFRQLLSGAGLTIGEVTARAKAATGNTDVRRTWILLGDPATKLK